MLRTALVVCVPIAGFVAGRGVPSSSAKPEAAVPAGKATVAAPRGEDLPALLCEISVGNLTAARKRIAQLRDAEGSDSELGKLLVAIAMKDGASFDALLATFPEESRSSLVERCAMLLANEPAAFVRLLAESEEFSQVALGPRRYWALQAIQAEPALFVDLLEQGKITWPVEAITGMVREVRPDPASALRLLDL